MKRRAKLAAGMLLLAMLAGLAHAEIPTAHISETGTRYYRQVYRPLMTRKVPLRMFEAGRQGHAPYGICLPPTLTNTLSRVSVENPATYREAGLSRMVPGIMARHVNGHTVVVAMDDPPLELQAVERTWMLGVDTFDLVHLQEFAEYLAKVASEFTQDRALGISVFLAFGLDLPNLHGRLFTNIDL